MPIADHHRPAGPSSTRERRHADRDRARPDARSWPRTASRPRSRAARSGPIRSGARWRGSSCRSASSPTSSASGSSSTRSTNATGRSASSTAPGARCPAASRTISRRRSRTTTARSTPPSIGPHHSASRCRSAPRECTRSPSAGWRRTPSTRTASVERPATACACRPPISNAYRWLRHLVDMLLGGRQCPRSSSSTPSSSCSRTRSSASRPRASSSRCRAGRRHRLRLCGPHRVGDSCVGAGQWPPCAARHRAREWRRGRDHPLGGPDAARRLGGPGGHRQGPGRDPPRHARRGAQPYAGLGREIVERMLPPGDRLLREGGGRRLPELGIKNIEDALAAIGRGELSASTC